jgi:hypothetical protein
MTVPETPTARLTRELVDIGGPLASLVHHMQEQASNRGKDPAGVTAILADLIEPTLAGLVDGWPEERIGDAADVLHAACERVCQEIFILPAPNRAQRRRMRRRP